MTRSVHRKSKSSPRNRDRHSPLTRLWFRLVAFGFRLLYNELAWTYDCVSSIVSLGRWRTWQETSLHFLPLTGPVLELASGPGHLLVAQRERGLTPVGLDPSSAMIRLAGRRLRRAGLPLSLCRGSASHLPFPADSFAAIVVTFPTDFIYEHETHSELARVLRVCGKLVIVEQASFLRRRPVHRLLEWLYRITGQRGPAPDLAPDLDGAGFVAKRHSTEVRGTVATLIIAQKTDSTSGAGN